MSPAEVTLLFVEAALALRRRGVSSIQITVSLMQVAAALAVKDGADAEYFALAARTSLTRAEKSALPTLLEG